VLARVAHAYSNFATENPAFAELREAVASVAGGRDVDTLAEVLWAALHGLNTLGHNDRLRPGRETERIELLVGQFTTPAPETLKSDSRERGRRG
jgi:hypothetical protein